MQKNDTNENSNIIVSEGLLKLALVIVLILIQGIAFLYIWVNFYNPELRFPYVLKGNIFLMLMYMGLSYIIKR